MAEIVMAVFLAAGCAGIFLTARLCSRLLRAVERLDASVRAAVPAQAETNRRSDVQQEKYEQGVANILAYGTREMVRRRGDAQ